jgi:hypothetical protein
MMQYIYQLLLISLHLGHRITINQSVKHFTVVHPIQTHTQTADQSYQLVINIKKLINPVLWIRIRKDP